MTKSRTRLIRRLKLFARALLRLVTGRPPSTEEVTRANTRQAYEKLYSDPRLLQDYLAPVRLQFFREVALLCVSLHPARVMDLGCGTGHMLQAISDTWQHRGIEPLPTLFGMDQARAAISQARNVVPHGHFTVGSIYQMSYLDASFDLVFSTETFEHLDQPNLALREATRICQPGGHIILTVPDGEQDDWEGHVNFWSMTTLHDFLSQTLHVDEIRRVDEGRVLMAFARKGD